MQNCEKMLIFSGLVDSAVDWVPKIRFFWMWLLIGHLNTRKYFRMSLSKNILDTADRKSRVIYSA
jgi:hypothetical protein